MTKTTPALAGSIASTLITAHGGRVTRTRVAVLATLQAEGQPMSHDDLAAALVEQGEHHDRVTLYRALDWLVEQGIAHRVAGGDRVWRFAVARPEAHQHAHFHCGRCGQVLCLENLLPSFAIALPAGYRMDRAELTLHGTCPGCADR